MPAAAVIPAPIAYIKIVAVKKLVVGSLWLSRLVRRWRAYCFDAANHSVHPLMLFTECLWVSGTFTLKKLECSKQALSLNIRAWNNKRGLRGYFIGYRLRGND